MHARQVLYDWTKCQAWVEHFHIHFLGEETVQCRTASQQWNWPAHPSQWLFPAVFPVCTGSGETAWEVRALSGVPRLFPGLMLLLFLIILFLNCLSPLQPHPWAGDVRVRCLLDLILYYTSFWLHICFWDRASRPHQSGWCVNKQAWQVGVGVCIS